MSMSRRCSGSTWRSRRRVALLALAGGLLAAGCGLTPAEWFERDAYFVEAVPDTVRTRIRLATHLYPAEELAVTVAVMTPLAESLNELTLSVLRVSEFITADTPDIREESLRVWGPEFSPLYDVSYELEVSETEPLRYEYELAVASGVESQLDDVLLSGTYLGMTLGQGTGQFQLDLDAANRILPGVFGGTEHGGQVSVIHEFGPDSLAIGMDLADTEVADDAGVVIQPAGQYAYRSDTDGGMLCYDAAEDVVGGDLVEDLWVHARWRAGGSGRADGELSGGDLGGHVDFTECWDSRGERTYWWDSAGNEVGDASACVFDDSGIPGSCAQVFPEGP